MYEKRGSMHITQPGRAWWEHFSCRRVMVVISATIMCCLGAPALVNAQDVPRLEVSAGYAVLSQPRLDDVLPKGFYASGAFRLSRWLSLVGEVGWNARHEMFGTVMPESIDKEVTAFLAGPRFSFWSSTRVAPFAEVLVGGRHERSHVQAGGPEDPFRFDSTIELTDPALQPGGGIVLWLHRRLGAQVSLHYRRTLGRSVDGLELPEIDDWRLATGVTVGF